MFFYKRTHSFSPPELSLSRDRPIAIHIDAYIYIYIYIPGIAFNADKIILFHTSICSKVNPLETHVSRDGYSAPPRRE